MRSLRRSRSASGGHTGARRVRGSRPVSALYGILSVVLLAAALVMALIVRPPPPPSIAELGPSPQEQIEEARDNQAAGSGSGDLATGAEEKKQTQTSTQQAGQSATTTPPTTTSSTKKVPGTRRCYGDPPRQTEDPHSPRCVFEIFQGDNGGDTAQGVTGTEISVAITDCYFDDTVTAFRALGEHFNRRYEFYGRRITLDVIEVQGAPNCASQSSPSHSQALANEVVSKGPFASVVLAAEVFQGEFHRTLSEAGIHSVEFLPRWESSELVDGWTWLVAPAVDSNQRVAGDVICDEFRGRKARHAGEPNLAKRDRKFAVISTIQDNDGDGYYPDVSALVARLRSCGAVADSFKVAGRNSQYAFSDPENEQKMRDIEAGGYTSVVMVGNSSAYALVARRAADVSYFPEWFAVDSDYLAHSEFPYNRSTGFSESEQFDQFFGITPRVRVSPFDATPAFWALEDGEGSRPRQWWTVEPVYKKLLVVASGIQGAGPNLTADTFRQALWNTVWPNPNAGGPPHWQQQVSFSPGDPVFYDDFAVWWWNKNRDSQTPSEQNPDGRGSFCYISSGGRFIPGSFPGNVDRRLFGEGSC